MDILPDMSLADVTDQVDLDKSICQTQMQKWEKKKKLQLLKVFELANFLCAQNDSWTWVFVLRRCG